MVPGQANEDYARRYNPLRKIPALMIDETTVITDSTVICEYLDARAGGGRLIPAAGEGRWRVLSQHALAQGMCDAAISIRYETWLRPEERRWPTWIDDQWDKIWTGLDWFEAHEEALEAPITVAHLALGCLLGYIGFRFPEAEWRGTRPRLDQWFSALSRRDSFARTQPTAPS